MLVSYLALTAVVLLMTRSFSLNRGPTNWLVRLETFSREWGACMGREDRVDGRP